VAAVTLPDLLDTDALLTDEERDVRAATRQLVDELVRPHIADWYERGELPVRDLAQRFGAAGLLGMHLTGHGCAGLTTTAYGLACLELEAGDSGIRSLVSVQGSLAMYAIHRYGSDAQRDRWLPGMAAGELIGCFGLTEPESGSDPGSMRTRATEQDGGYRLDGAKMWITNGSVADVAVVWAKLADPETGRDRVRGFVVPTDTPGFAAYPITGKLSLRASATAELVLDGVVLPADALLPAAAGLGAPLSCLVQARTGIAFGALGAARDCLAVAVDYTTGRTQFGRPLAAFQLTQAKLADAVTAWTAGYLLALQLGRLADASGDAAPAPAVSMGKLNSTRTALEIARSCRTMLGGNGITGAYPVMRHAANLETVLTYEGTAEVHQLILGRALTGLNALS
jgi:glutaryl-CoA dehydrogenase